MAETNSTPTPGPAPAPKAKRSPGPINQEWLDEFTFAEGIVAATQVTGRPAILADGDIDAAKITALTDAIVAARKLTGQAVQGTSGKRIITHTEEDLKKVLLKRIHYVQARARQKYDSTEPGRLTEYGIGQHISNSRSLLEQAAENILLKLSGDPAAVPPVPPDVLPGMPADRITGLKAALADYKGVQGDQTGAQGDATKFRSLVEAAVADIIAKRREIQFAADAEWPHTDPANAGIRAEFKLPSDQAMQ